jgi:hypothetical protein
LPSSEVSLASAVAVRFPACNTVPSALTRPVAVLMARRYFSSSVAVV